MSTNKTPSEVTLSAKQRKKLSSSTFCGPNRSFPVPDCNHVRAGLSLLGRYKGPGDKARIRACIYRKAKSLKCFKGDGGKEFAGLDVLQELLNLYNERALSYSEIVAVVVDMCENMKVSKREMADIIGLANRGEIDSALALLSKSIA